MPRRSRIDAPGALHHIIAGGIARQKIFDDNYDRNNFLDRLGALLKETQTLCFAWALLPNHFHLLVRTATVPIATVMRRLLTGYAITYNRRHRRWGHLFQNRYKSILCQEEPYLLELVRYIHLNPLRAGIVDDMGHLDRFLYCGHSAVIGKTERNWQDTGYVLQMFGKRVSSARRKYREFVYKGIGVGQRPDFVGGGLIRSMGGWSAVKALRRAKVYHKGDERILGESEFVDQVLSVASEAYAKGYQLRSRGMDVDQVAERVARLLSVSVNDVWSAGRYKKIVTARSLLCYWAVRELGVSLAELSRRLNISSTAVSKSVGRGEKLASEYQYSLFD